MYILGANMYH